MPIYEYKCTACGAEFEEMRSVKDNAKIVPCQQCKKDAHKKVSLGAFHLKGGGWSADSYVTPMEKFKENLAAVDNY